MLEERFNHWCSVWAKEFAIRHPDDLSQEERSDLHEHASTCPDCAGALRQYHLCNALLRDYPFEEMFLAESTAAIRTNGKVPAALEQFWEEEDSTNANNRRELREKRIDSKPNAGNQKANGSTDMRAVKPLPHNEVTTSPRQSYIVDVRIVCSDKFSELVVGEGHPELIVESVVGTALLAIFGGVRFEHVTIDYPPEGTSKELEVNYPDFAKGHPTL